jgi:hypothetical protein
VIRDPFGHRWLLNGPLTASNSSAEKTKAGAEKKPETK